ncbi:MAG: hypothetical protein AMXMBFR77_27900 [Phycisphaerales bacterium]
MKRLISAILGLVLCLLTTVAVAQWTTYPGGPLRLPPDGLQIPAVSGLASGCEISGSYPAGVVAFAGDGTLCYSTAAGSPATWAAVGSGATPTCGDVGALCLEDVSANKIFIGSGDESGAWVELEASQILCRGAATPAGGCSASAVRGLLEYGSSDTGKGASLVALEDMGGHVTVDNVEAGIAEAFTALGGKVAKADYGGTGCVLVGTGAEMYSCTTLTSGRVLGDFGAGVVGGTASDVRSFLGLETSNDLVLATTMPLATATNVSNSAALWDGTNRLSYTRLTGEENGGTATLPFVFYVPPGVASVAAIRIATVWSDPGAGANAGVLDCADTTGSAILTSFGLTEALGWAWESIPGAGLGVGTYSAGGLLSCVLSVTTDAGDTVDVYAMSITYQR